MTIDELNDDEKMEIGCSLKVITGGTSASLETIVQLPSNVIEVEFTEAKVESLCENGVCSVIWKPRRIA